MSPQSDHPIQCLIVMCRLQREAAARRPKSSQCRASGKGLMLAHCATYATLRLLSVLLQSKHHHVQHLMLPYQKPQAYGLPNSCILSVSDAMTLCHFMLQTQQDWADCVWKDSCSSSSSCKPDAAAAWRWQEAQVKSRCCQSRPASDKWQEAQG